jgi:hypothetical protein
MTEYRNDLSQVISSVQAAWHNPDKNKLPCNIRPNTTFAKLQTENYTSENSDSMPNVYSLVS